MSMLCKSVCGAKQLQLVVYIQGCLYTQGGVEPWYEYTHGGALLHTTM